MAKYSKFIYNAGKICASWIAVMAAMLSSALGLTYMVSMWAADSVAGLFTDGLAALVSVMITLACLLIFRYLWDIQEESEERLDSRDDLQ